MVPKYPHFEQFIADFGCNKVKKIYSKPAHSKKFWLQTPLSTVFCEMFGEETVPGQGPAR